jgi:hypothetical protein
MVQLQVLLCTCFIILHKNNIEEKLLTTSVYYFENILLVKDIRKEKDYIFPNQQTLDCVCFLNCAYKVTFEFIFIFRFYFLQ